MSITPKETADAETLPKPTTAEFENPQLNLFQALFANNPQERDKISHAIGQYGDRNM